MDSIEIQKVSADDLMEIRHLVLWPDKPREFVKVPEDESGIHFGLYFEGALVSVISLFCGLAGERARVHAPTTCHYVRANRGLHAHVVRRPHRGPRILRTVWF